MVGFPWSLHVSHTYSKYVYNILYLSVRVCLHVYMGESVSQACYEKKIIVIITIYYIICDVATSQSYSSILFYGDVIHTIYIYIPTSSNIILS